MQINNLIKNNHIVEMSSISQTYIEHFMKTFEVLQQLKDNKITIKECDDKIREINKGIIIPYIK